MIRNMIFVCLSLIVIWTGSISATPISGRLTGTIPLSGSPYEITGDIYVPIRNFLEIEPGVVFNFQGNYIFKISNGAELNAIGTPDDSIFFICDTTLFPGGWGGIRFDSCGNSCELQYCRVEFAKNGGILGLKSSPSILNCHISHNWTTSLDSIAEQSSGITFLNNSNPIIQDNVIEDNFIADGTSGILIDHSRASIIGNIIRGGISSHSVFIDQSQGVSIIDNTIGYREGDDGVALKIDNTFGVFFKGNLITQNRGLTSGEIIDFNNVKYVTFKDNILSYNSAIESQLSPMFEFESGIYFVNGNIVANNQALEWPGFGFYGGAIIKKFSNNIFIDNSSTSETQFPINDIQSDIVVNCIFWNNSPQTPNSGPVKYCDIEGGFAGEGNINLDPQFRDPATGDFHLMSTACGDLFDSPCIDAGSPHYYDDSLSCENGQGTMLCDMGIHGGPSLKCYYIPGDINDSGEPNGIDIVYFINWLKGGAPPPNYCDCDGDQSFYPAGDVNGNCSTNGIDVSYYVGFLKGGQYMRWCTACVTTALER